MKIELAFAGLLACALAGCGTITRGTTENIPVAVSPPTAQVTTNIGMTCANPCVLKVPRKESFTVTATAPGYEPQTVYVGTKISGGGAAGLAGNILVGGVIGVAVDAGTGASLDHYPNPVNITLVPLPPPPAPKKGPLKAPAYKTGPVS